MKTLIFSALLLIAGTSWAGSYTVAWDANPPAENVTSYALFVNGKEVWTGPGLQAPVTANAGDRITVRARNAWGESADSEAIVIGSVPSAPGGLKIVNISITVN